MYGAWGSHTPLRDPSSPPRGQVMDGGHRMCSPQLRFSPHPQLPAPRLEVGRGLNRLWTALRRGKSSPWLEPFWALSTSP